MMSDMCETRLSRLIKANQQKNDDGHKYCKLCYLNTTAVLIRIGSRGIIQRIGSIGVFKKNSDTSKTFQEIVQCR